MHLFADYHTHTNYSHGRGSIRENVEAAQRAGLREVAISDHGPANLFGIGVAGVEKFLEIKAEVQSCRREFPELTVLTAAEANVISVEGTLDLPREIIGELDLLLAGLHLMIRPETPGDALHLVAGNLLATELLPGLARRVRRITTLALTNALRRYDIAVLTHPGLYQHIDLRELARVSAEEGTALEISARHNVLSAEDIRTVRSEGALLAVNSDAHRPREVGRLENGLRLIRETGLDAENIINAE